MKTFLPIAVVLLATGCATTHSPKVDVSMSIDKQNANLIFVKVKIVNTENTATVPISIEVAGQTENNGHWDKASTILHPAAFVLNKNEQREITKLWRVPADAARTTLTVKEQERGNLLKTERTEKVFASANAAGAPGPAKP
jgi:alpha-L-arabinofuranosidase